MMWPSLAGGGVVVFLFGLFFTLNGIGFAIPFMIVGPIMIIAALILPEVPPVKPENPNMKYCRFCLKEIPLQAETCPECGLLPD
ncbi:MAG: hypothetical protein HY619_05260 [Thaumarchaeota archaeon]|nr:hypothetical protein [Nitrososphaerota archaeon]